MRKLLAVLILLLFVVVSLGCLNKAEDRIPVTTSAASSVLKLNSPPAVNQSQYAAFTCQLNMSRGSGLGGKEINWFIDNVRKDSSITQWGYASLNLTSEETQQLSIGKHTLKASFDGDSDYSSSNDTAVFQVHAAPTPTPTPKATPTPSAEPESRSITLNAPSSAKLGSISVSGTHSGLKAGENIYVLTKPKGNDTWTMQNPSDIGINRDGTFRASLTLNNRGDYDVVALITGSHYDADATLDKLPSAAAESKTSITVS